jgi:hypothetical protein
MAGNEVRESLRGAAESVVRYVKDVATLTVETRTTESGTPGDTVLAARTVICFDGDNSSVLPARRNEAGQLVVDAALYELHMQNVSAAIEYRARLLDSMLGLLASRVPG